jgi:hypothetical protein
VEELLAERGTTVDHVSIYRWVQRFTPLLVDAVRLAAGDSLRDYGRCTRLVSGCVWSCGWESGDRQVIGDNDKNIGAAIMAELSRLVSGPDRSARDDEPRADRT